MMTLKNKVEIIVPQKDNNGIEISSPAIKESVITITKIVGGCSITEIKGQWWSDDEQRIMEDDNLNIEWYYSKDMDVKDKEILAIELGRIIDILVMEYDQEGVSVKINGTLYIIDESDLDTLDEDYIKDELQELMF